MPQKVFAMIYELEELFTVQQLAELIHKKPATIYSDITRRPNELPPIFRASPTSKPLFVNPREWVMEKVRKQQALQEACLADSRGATYLASQAVQPKRKRGRPSNLEIQKRKESETNSGSVVASENSFSVKTKIDEDARKRGRIVEPVHFLPHSLAGRKGGGK